MLTAVFCRFRASRARPLKDDAKVAWRRQPEKTCREL